MYTIIETPSFQRDAAEIWSEEERSLFFTHLAQHPEDGEVIQGTNGCRKIRWSREGTGKRGGVRVIYFTKLVNGEIWLLVIYSKTVKESIPAYLLKAIREAIEND